MKVTVTYLGDLRTLGIHPSGEQITTDAPKDNQGLGAYFSPTDLVATSLASCFLTIVGIYCKEREIPLSKICIDVEKIMASNPRRIAQINLLIDLMDNLWDEPTRKKIIAVGKTCPVAATLGNQVTIEYAFK
ncbi:MAG: OsmC family protein [Bacteroidetes bacterium]|nr:OsmC family protein [Bacteroidota bacterium]MBM3424695.1 OsmC family protein [Bacteroidota bacterium]